MKSKVKSANGVSGCLLYMHGLGTYVFRVYNNDGEFTDYDIRHCDLGVTIDDPDAYFYVTTDGKATLDHSPETLGHIFT